MKTTHFTHHQAQGLLHNKFVIIMGGSNLRTMYKDLVLILQKDNHLSFSQLKTKGEATFENDKLLEGGRLAQMTNGTEYKEVRQYTSDHHLVRFYFITRVYSDYMKKILEELENGLKPDLVIVNSCVWDISRYGRLWERDYAQNLTTFFKRLRSILPEEVLIIWTMAMPLSEKIIGGFLEPEIAGLGPSLRFDVVEANFWSASLASGYSLDVLDLHFHFRFSLQHQAKDGVHWNAIAHRHITCLLLAHIANSWGVKLPPLQPTPQPLKQIQTGQNHHSFFGQCTPMFQNFQYSGKAQRPGLTVTVSGWRPTHTKPHLLATAGPEGRQVRIMGPSQIQGGHRDVQMIPHHHSQAGALLPTPDSLLPTPEPSGCSRDGNTHRRPYTPRAPYYPLRDPYPRYQPYPPPRQTYPLRQPYPPPIEPPRQQYAPSQPYPPPRQTQPPRQVPREQCAPNQPYPSRQTPKQPYPPRQIQPDSHPPRQTPSQPYPPRQPYPQRELFAARREPYPPRREPYPLHRAPPREPYLPHSDPHPPTSPPTDKCFVFTRILQEQQITFFKREPNGCGGSWQYFNGLDPYGDSHDSQLTSSKGGWIFVDMEEWSGCDGSRQCFNGQDPYGGPYCSQLTSSEGQDFLNDCVLPRTGSHEEGFFLGHPPQPSHGANYGYALRRKHSGRHYRPY